MPTVLDSLIIELKLDPAKELERRQRETSGAFKRTRDDSARAALELERHAKTTSEFFSQLQRRVITLFAAFTAGRDLKEFIADLVTTDAAVGRMARVMGASVGTLASWRNMAVLTGGSAEATTGSLNGLVQQFQQFAITGESSVIPYFRALGINLVDAGNKMRPVQDILLDLSTAFAKLDPARAEAFGRALGLDQGTINLLLKGPTALRAMLAEQQRLGIEGERDRRAAEKLQTAWGRMTQASTELGRTLMTQLGPALRYVLDALTRAAEWLAQHPKILDTVFAGGTALIAGIATAITVSLIGSAIPAAIGAFGSLGIAALGVLGPGGIILVAIAGVALALAALHESLGLNNRAPFAARPRGGAPFSPEQPALGRSNFVPPFAPNSDDVAKLVSLGWTREQAIGIAANIQRESGGNAGAVGDSGNAYGLAQWHPDRQAAFARWAGHSIREATRDEQLAFINYELRQGSDAQARQAGTFLAGTNDAASAAAIVSRLYERPADVGGEATARAAIAAAMVRAAAAPQTASLTPGAIGGATGGGISTNTTSNQTSIDTINVHTQATDAVGVARDLRPAIERNAFSSQANYGPN